MYPFTCPSGLEVELREMTGAEESLMTNARLVRSGDALNQVLTNCLVRIGENDASKIEDVLSMLSGDRQFILVKLREISSESEEITLTLTCPNSECAAENLVTINLADLKVTEYPTAREFAVTLPRSKKAVKFIHLNGHMERRLATLREPDIHAAMLMRIMTVDGAPPTQRTLKEWPLRDIAFLREEMQKVDGGVDTSLKSVCTTCGAKIATRLEAEPSFLFLGLRF